MKLVLVLGLAALLSSCGISEDRVPRRIDVAPAEIEMDVDESRTGILGS